MADLHDIAAAPFEPGFEDWQRLVAASLKDGDVSRLVSQTRDGIRIEPLYQARRDAVPIAGRGAKPWTIVQPVDHPDPEHANRQAREDLAGSATGLALRFTGAPAAARFGLPVDADALQTVLDGIDLSAIHLRIDPHHRAADSADWLLEISKGFAREAMDIAFGLDPISVAAAAGVMENDSSESAVGAFRRLCHSGFKGPFIAVDSRVVHESGGTETQELAFMLASAAWWLRAIDERGATAETVFPYFGGTITVDQDQLLSIAKIRALRLLWARLQEVCGAAATKLPIHAETSRRMITRADPHGNVLRTTIAAFSAGIGGADSIAILPFTAALGLAERSARSLARNTQHLLMEEANLHCVADPAAGSGVLEALTDALAERAWAAFQAIEAEGGILHSLQAGAFQARIAETRAAFAGQAANGRLPLVGSSIYPAPAGPPQDMEDVEPWPRPEPSLHEALAPIRLEALAPEAAP